MSDHKTNRNSKLLDFDFVGDQHFDIADMLHEAYLEGRKDFQKELESKLQKGLQTSAGFASLFKSKLQDHGIEVKDMYLRIVAFSEFEALVLIKDSDYYDKNKRWNAYDISREVNLGIDDLDLKFSLMPHSESVQTDIINSEGFYFKYATK